MTVRHRAIIPALVVVALCLHNPWGFSALPDAGIVLIMALSLVVLIPVWRSETLRWSMVEGLMLVAIAGGVLSAFVSDASAIALLGRFTKIGRAHV